MTVATQQANGYFRTVPLQGEEHQECQEIGIEDVPPLSTAAVVTNVTPRSVRYDAGRETWFTHPVDKTVIRAYRKRRSDEDIEAGAFPNVCVFFDGKGPL